MIFLEYSEITSYARIMDLIEMKDIRNFLSTIFIQIYMPIRGYFHFICITNRFTRHKTPYCVYVFFFVLFANAHNYNMLPAHKCIKAPLADFHIRITTGINVYMYMKYNIYNFKSCGILSFFRLNKKNMEIRCEFRFLISIFFKADGHLLILLYICVYNPHIYKYIREYFISCNICKNFCHRQMF